ncbi:MAG: InlB B-repeat-containing protein, partial [Clostridia bacterium]|nr:InlB B-repeat-containing protein [Clostridia bacterium]
YIPKNQKQDIVLADIADITANDFMAYLDDFKDWSSSVEGTIGNYYCLRDDYVLYTQDQNPYGLCWSYSANMALTTSIMMKTGEYYDFSENWISTTFDYLCNSGEYNDLKNKLKLMIKNFNTYNLGGGGLFFLHDYISRMAGVVLESDFNYTDFQVLCSENAGLAYEMYSQYANEYIMNNLISGYFNVYTDDEYSSQSSVIMSSIRSHIKNYGAVSANMYWNSTYATNCTSTNNINEKTITYKTPNTYKASNNSAHAITLIGWDNNIELTDTQGITHTGAWIALNSWGDNWGDDGVFYIAYDDSDFYGFYGYKYQSKASDTGTSGLHLSTNIKESNASYSTSLKGKYYDDLEPEDPQLTLQRNIFYIDNIPVTNGEKIYKISYGYTPTNNTEISNIKLFRYQQDITYSKKYKTSVLFSDNAINIVASNLDAGVYKVLIEYTDGTNYEEFLTCFYVMNGSEINKAEHYFGDTVSTNYSTTNPSGIYNNGVYNLHNDYNYEDGSLVFYSKSLSEKLTIDFQLSVYSSVASVEKESNNSYATIRKSAKGDVYEYVINYDLNEKNNYPLTLTSTGGTTKTLNIYIYLANASDNMINVMYDTAGGANNELNLKRTIVSSGSSAKIYQPIASDCEEGKYIFNGWYTDSELTKPLQKIDNEGSAYWLLPYSSVSIISNPTLDSSCKTNFATCLYNASFVYLYADWSYQPPIYNITFVYNNGDEDQTFEYEKYSTIIEPTIEREGYNLIGWYTTDTFEDNSIWSFNAHVTEDITLYAKWEIKKFNVNIFYYDTETANEVYSTENGTGIAYNSTLTLPNVLKKGYTLLCFYTEDNNLLDFNTGITYDLNLYAKWSLNEMQSVSIEPSVLATETFTKFTVSASFIHEKNFATSSALSIQWYKNGEEYQTTSTITSESEGNSYIHTITITNKVEIVGNYTYYAIISIQEDQYFTSETTERVTIAISKKEVGISNIDYSNKKEISWKDDEAGSGYVVNLFKKVNESFELVYSTNNPSESKDNIDVWTNGIKSKNGGKGVYYIQIQKYIGEDNIGSVETNEFSIFEVKYNTTMPLDNNYLPSLVDDGDIVSEPTVPTAPYYTFA